MSLSGLSSCRPYPPRAIRLTGVGRFAAGAAVGIERVVEKPPQHDVDHRRAGLDELESGFAGVVMHPDHRALQPQERLACGQTRGDGHFALEVQTFAGVLVDASNHGMRPVSSKARAAKSRK